MRDLDQVVGRVEEERVQTELGTGAGGNDGRIEFAVTPGLDRGRDAQCRSARRIFFLRVMALFHPRLILRESRNELPGPLREAENDVGSRRKVRRADAGN